MLTRPERLRILLYSHDTFGLGHFRRSRAIANHLADEFPGAQLTILTGAQVAEEFDMQNRVELVKLPGVSKIGDGIYEPADRVRSLCETLTLRRCAISRTADLLDPHLFIVDKEPLGLLGEAEDALRLMRRRGTRLVLGLRDVLDAPERVLKEWTARTVQTVEELYDELWIYGPKQFYHPLHGVRLTAALSRRTKFLGFIGRPARWSSAAAAEEDQILVTAGGGGDGTSLLRGVVAAYRSDPTLKRPALLVAGPYMTPHDFRSLVQAASGLRMISVKRFEKNMEMRLASASAVLAMCGYNTFCEILSFDKPALFVPRVAPRSEQLLRAARAQRLGLAGMLDPAAAQDPKAMAAAVHELGSRPRPSSASVPLSMDGLHGVASRVAQLLLPLPRAHLSFRALPSHAAAGE